VIEARWGKNDSCFKVRLVVVNVLGESGLGRRAGRTGYLEIWGVATKGARVHERKRMTRRGR